MHGELQLDAPSLKHHIVVDGVFDHLDGRLSWTRLLASGAKQAVGRPALDWLRPSPDEVTSLGFTSGTTGQPKGVWHTPNTLAASLEAMVSSQQLTANDVFHMASTVGHHSGFEWGVRLALHLGA